MVPITCMHGAFMPNVDLSFYYFVLHYKLFINFLINSETKSLYALLSPLENKDGT